MVVSLDEDGDITCEIKDNICNLNIKYSTRLPPRSHGRSPVETCTDREESILCYEHSHLLDFPRNNIISKVGLREMATAGHLAA